MAPKIKVKERVTAEGVIDLSMSDLEEVPIKDILQFKKIHDLDLSNNKLAALPPTFSSLTHLTKLDLSKNELVGLPDNFGDLAKLKHLDLYSNRLERLPLSFGKLKELKWLDLKDNPLIPTLAKVAGPCLDMKQCQMCARNIVNFFVKLEEQVNTDLEERQKVRKRQMEINQQKKQEEKKAKKKEKQKQRQEVYTSKKSTAAKQVKEQNVDILIRAPSATSSNSQVIPAIKAGSVFKKFFKVAMLTGTILFISTSVKWKYTENVELTVKDLYSFLLGKVPQNFRSYGISFGELVHGCHETTGSLTLNVIHYLNETIPQSKREQLYNSTRSCLHYCMEKIKEVYNHFSNK